MSRKNMFLADFSKISWYFFPIVTRPLTRVCKTLFVKNSKKMRNFKYVKNRLTTFFSIFWKFEKIMFLADFSENSGYFFPVASCPLRRVSKTLFVKNSKKLRYFKYVKNRLTTFFPIFWKFEKSCFWPNSRKVLDIFV